MVEKIRNEEFEITGDALVSKLKELLHAGNIRRVTIKNEQGVTLIEIPLLVGAAAVVLLPVWAAIGAIAALAARLKIVIERVEVTDQVDTSSSAAEADADSTS